MLMETYLSHMREAALMEAYARGYSDFCLQPGDISER